MKPSAFLAVPPLLAGALPAQAQTVTLKFQQATTKGLDGKTLAAEVHAIGAKYLGK